MTLLPQNTPSFFMKNYIRVSSGLVSMKDFETEMAYAMLAPESFDVMRPKPYPSRPFLMHEYSKKSKVEKNKVSDEFWRLPIIENYLSSKDRIINQNNTFKARLMEIKNIIPAGDIVAHTKIRDRLLEFEVYIYEL